MKKITGILMAIGLVGSTAFGAMLNEGTRELSIAGDLDRDTAALGVSFGQFVIDGLILGLGVNGAYEDFGNDNEFSSYGANVFAQYHLDLASPLVPFAGLAGGVQYAKLKTKEFGSESETGWMGEAQLGVKTFIANNIAIATYGFFDFSNKEIYSDKDEMEKTNYGLRIGMNSYF